MKRLVGIVLVVVAVSVVLLALSSRSRPYEKSEKAVLASDVDLNLAQVSDYVKSNISQLSPEKAVLGGKFQVLSISFGLNKGIVNYEDGHIALSAIFEYSTSSGNVIISDFKIISNREPSFTSADFVKIGNLVMYENDKNFFSLVYEGPGKPALHKVLIFSEDSLCQSGQEYMFCKTFVLTPGDRVKVEGRSQAYSVQVLKLKKIQ